jgi:hypothetical protein
MEPIESFEHAGKTVNIYWDEDAESPRDWDNTAIFACSHRRYNLGDRQQHFESEEALRESIDGVLAVMPLYLYDHSGITISCKPFGCSFDSGQVGWAYVTRERAEHMGFEVSDDADVAEDAFLSVIEDEVKTYDQYLRGDVYGYQVKGREGERLDSCWGFFDLDDCIEQAKSSAEYAEDPADARGAEELSSRATYASVV